MDRSRGVTALGRRRGPPGSYRHRHADERIRRKHVRNACRLPCTPAQMTDAWLLLIPLVRLTGVENQKRKCGPHAVSRAAWTDPRGRASEPQAPIRTKAQAGRALLTEIRISSRRHSGRGSPHLRLAPRSGRVGRAPPAGGARIQDRMATGPREQRAGARTQRGADGVNAWARNGMRRKFEYPDAEQVERLWRFVAGASFPRRV